MPSIEPTSGPRVGCRGEQINVTARNSRAMRLSTVPPTLLIGEDATGVRVLTASPACVRFPLWLSRSARMPFERDQYSRGLAPYCL